MFGKFFKSFSFNNDYRADTHNPKYSLKSLHCLFIIKGTVGLHIDSSFFLGDNKTAFYILQYLFDTIYQSVLKDIPVFSLDTDLTVFNQKCLKHIFLLYRRT